MPDIDSSTIAVPVDLEGAGAYINSQAAAISAELDALIKVLAPLQDTWVGSAHTYYHGLQAEWNIAAEGLFGPTGVLGQIANAMNVTWANYSDAEWANVRTWQH
jgi:WXG100 family type VII secretion target